MGFFFGRIAYRIAGCTDDFESETAKKQFRRLAEKFHQVTVEVDQQKKLVFLAEEAVSTLEGKLFSPNNFEIFQSSVSFTYRWSTPRSDRWTKWRELSSDGDRAPCSRLSRGTKNDWRNCAFRTCSRPLCTTATSAICWLNRYLGMLTPTLPRLLPI